MLKIELYNTPLKHNIYVFQANFVLLLEFLCVCFSCGCIIAFTVNQAFIGIYWWKSNNTCSHISVDLAGIYFYKKLLAKPALLAIIIMYMYTWACTLHCICYQKSRGGHLYFRLDIIRVKGLSKHTLNTYFSGMKIDPKYAFLHAFFLIWASCPFQNLSIWQKTYPFSQFCTFLHP